MAYINNVLIGIQARSTSSRFPRKSFAMLGDKPLLQHVIDACQKSAVYENKFSIKKGTLVKVCVLVPYGDEISKSFRANIIEGPEDDVLTRYVMAAEKTNADYIVRITADCPLIPPFLISKHITAAVMNKHDYLSNVDERIRTNFDGLDCEVISKEALAWLNENATDPKDREHVTTKFRREPPKWANVGHVVGYADFSDVKLSVDTPEDLERVRKHYDKIQNAIDSAGSFAHQVHRF